MIYRLVIKLLGHVNQALVYKFCTLYCCLLYKLCQFIHLKRSIPMSPVAVMGLSFANPIGLAAGFDRQGTFLRYSPITGFGLIEIGTINIDLNYNAAKLIHNLDNANRHCQKTTRQQLLGINLGSLRNALDEQTISDYNKGMALFWNHADYLVINLSRPESPVRKSNPDIEGLTHFLKALKDQHSKLTAYHKQHLAPVVVKIAINYRDNDHTLPILSLVKDLGFDGVIIAFENWSDITKVSDYLRVLKSSVGKWPLIVVGGIHTTEDAKQILAAGASLVQIYTRLVQYGPLYIRKMISKLS